MRTHSNTIFITGGSSGIGLGLAEAFHKLGNRVIIGSRREKALQKICARNSGMNCVVVDTRSAGSIDHAAREIGSRFPELNCVVNNAGIQRMQDFAAAGGVDQESLAEEIEINLLGVIRVCGAFLPLLNGRPEATLINVSSGLAFVPISRMPVYCATKAAVHSFSISLRHQLKRRGVKVIELIPPYVDTNLDKGRRRPGGPAPMPLAQFVSLAMEALAGDGEEIAIGDAKFLHASAGTGEAFDKAVSRLNP